jgi:hypothetical protein
MGSSRYDNIIKENLGDILPDLFSSVLSLDYAQVEPLHIEQSLTLVRKDDFLFRVKTEPPYVLQIEFQSTNTPNMCRRMMAYCGLIYEKYGLPVRQVVFYLGKAKLSMKTEAQMPLFTYRYELIDFATLPAQHFLESERLGSVVFALFGDSSDKETDLLIERIYLKLLQKSSDHKELLRYVKQLEVLSLLRGLQEKVIQIGKKMPITIDIRKDLRYQQGGKDALLSTAMNMLREGSSVEFVCKVTGLKKETVIDLQKQMEREQ